MAESIVEDEELIQFQKEIEERYARSETKNFKFPRFS